ncbi:MAG: hypothetical protein JWN14_1586 [Chthonomonadales bacterium]|nr:hypothetical protein [Chthonomonadales bacterium]
MICRPGQQAAEEYTPGMKEFIPGVFRDSPVYH